MKFLYSDHLFPLLDYLCVTKKRELAFDFAIPTLIALIVYFKIEALLGSNVNCDFAKSIVSTLINMFAILVGFTITAIAIFVTSNTDNNELLKKSSERYIRGNSISNYKYIYLNLIYSSISSLTLLFLTIISSFLLYIDDYLVFIISFLTFGALHIILISIRNITTLYFIYSKN